ncbi:hypothetical protein AURDEDRAFT_186160 [Auricularia subglabra TFB-10046 SS5]|nr:hypothetical protein AURDEDRAFT_186160 [Auricularia subglabra TFB-10046 SS5]
MSTPPTTLPHLGFEAWVMCEDKHLPIYNIECVGNKTTCWIPSEAGKNFSVYAKLVDESLKMNVAAQLSVDGTYVGGRVFGTTAPHTFRQVAIEGRSNSASTMQKLVFSTLAMSDDDSAVRDGQQLADLGMLSLKITRVTVIGKATPIPTTHTPDKLAEGKLTVHERAKKLGGHRTTLGAEVTVAAQTTAPLKYHEVRAIFEFRYRPKDVLQAMDIIPAPPAKRPRETAGLHDTTNMPRAKKTKVTSGATAPKPEPVDEHDVPAMLARVRELEARLRERDGAVADDDNASIKREAEPINASHFFARGEVIDLTDD